ncbi:ethylene insensitive protein [Medicago truncatula]|uniref:Ethylene insensitive protein n=1 Tax=Medicago truncatula TaxID=3880 RepID=G7I9X0_MEDTR|nr:ethylene insensitive protein [Medicago truncatula]
MVAKSITADKILHDYEGKPMIDSSNNLRGCWKDKVKFDKMVQMRYLIERGIHPPWWPSGKKNMVCKVYVLAGVIKHMSLDIKKIRRHVFDNICGGTRSSLNSISFHHNSFPDGYHGGGMPISKDISFVVDHNVAFMMIKVNLMLCQRTTKRMEQFVNETYIIIKVNKDIIGDTPAAFTTNKEEREARWVEAR